MSLNIKVIDGAEEVELRRNKKKTVEENFKCLGTNV